MLATFYRPTAQRHKILILQQSFPSDRYAALSNIRQHGFDPKTALLTLNPRDGETWIQFEDIEAKLKAEGSQIALVLLEGVHFLSGQAFDIEKITGKQVKPTEFSTVNVVALMSLDEVYDLEKFHSKSTRSRYNVDTFCGLTFSPRKGKCLIFSTGKIISVGCKSEKIAKESILEAYEFLKKFGCVKKVNLVK